MRIAILLTLLLLSTNTWATWYSYIGSYEYNDDKEYSWYSNYSSDDKDDSDSEKDDSEDDSSDSSNYSFCDIYPAKCLSDDSKPTITVAEPETLLLFGLGLAVIGFLYRKKI